MADSVKRVLDAVTKKNDVAQIVVIDLSACKIKPADVEEGFMSRLRGVFKKVDRPMNIKNAIFVPQKFTIMVSIILAIYGLWGRKRLSLSFFINDRTHFY